MIYAWIPKPGGNPRGCGKTGGMTWKLNQDKILKGRRIGTNYSTVFRDQEVTSRDFRELRPQLRKMSIGLTEVHTIMDSRSSQKNNQKQVSYCVNQTRKRDVDIHWDSQAMRLVDLRLVQQTDIVIHCENLGCGELECQNQQCGIDTCGIFHYESWDGHTNAYLGQFWLNGPKEFYHLFDTEEIITDFNESDPD